VVLMLRPNLAVADRSMNDFLLPAAEIVAWDDNPSGCHHCRRGLLKRPSEITRISAQAAQFADAAIALRVSRPQPE